MLYSAWPILDTHHQLFQILHYMGGWRKSGQNTHILVYIDPRSVQNFIVLYAFVYEISAEKYELKLQRTPVFQVFGP